MGEAVYSTNDNAVFQLSTYIPCHRAALLDRIEVIPS